MDFGPNRNYKQRSDGLFSYSTSISPEIRNKSGLSPVGQVQWAKPFPITFAAEEGGVSIGVKGNILFNVNGFQRDVYFSGFLAECTPD